MQPQGESKDITITAVIGEGLKPTVTVTRSDGKTCFEQVYNSMFSNSTETVSFVDSDFN
jgi:hemoglobin-like flavoprotein